MAPTNAEKAKADADRQWDEAKEVVQETVQKGKEKLGQVAEDAQELLQKGADELTSAANQAGEKVKGTAQKLREAHSSRAWKKGAVIHDFCLGIPYGIVLLLGGLAWYAAEKDQSSLVPGVVFGLVQTALSYLSFQTWKSGSSNTPFILLSLAISSFLAFANGSLFIKGQADLVPTGLVGLASAIMTVFYLYVQGVGGNRPPKQD